MRRIHRHHDGMQQGPVRCAQLHTGLGLHEFPEPALDFTGGIQAVIVGAVDGV